MFNILLVCTGNTCRSPMAAGILKKLLPAEVSAKVQLESAGVSAGAGQSASDGAIRVSREREIDLSGHGARALTKELVENADLILVMQRMHLEEVSKLCPSRVEHALLLTEFGKVPGGDDGGIADPFGGSEEVYEECFMQIQRNLERGMGFLIELINAKEESR